MSAGGPTLYCDLVSGVVMWPVTYVGSISSRARNPLEWFPCGSSDLPSATLPRPTPGLVSRGLFEGGCFLGRRLCCLLTGPRTRRSFPRTLSLIGGPQASGIFSPARGEYAKPKIYQLITKLDPWLGIRTRYIIFGVRS
jgi:hypothetical protein